MLIFGSNIMSKKLFISSAMVISTMFFGVNYLVYKPVNAVELLDGKKAFENSSIYYILKLITKLPD